MADSGIIDGIIYRFELQDAFDEGDTVDITIVPVNNLLYFSFGEEAAGKKTNDHLGRTGHHA